MRNSFKEAYHDHPNLSALFRLHRNRGDRLAILYGLNRALADAAWPAGARTRAFRASAVVGVIFLILYATRKLSSLFAWRAGVGDIAIGLLAPVVGLAYARAPRDTAGLARAWNVFGISSLPSRPAS